jgi:hypothetical protein
MKPIRALTILKESVLILSGHQTPCFAWYPEGILVLTEEKHERKASPMEGDLLDRNNVGLHM